VSLIAAIWLANFYWNVHGDTAPDALQLTDMQTVISSGASNYPNRPSEASNLLAIFEIIYRGPPWGTLCYFSRSNGTVATTLGYLIFLNALAIGIFKPALEAVHSNKLKWLWVSSFLLIFIEYYELLQAFVLEFCGLCAAYVKASSEKNFGAGVFLRNCVMSRRFIEFDRFEHSMVTHTPKNCFGFFMINTTT
jgi:hypothetical protein